MVEYFKYAEDMLKSQGSKFEALFPLTVAGRPEHQHCSLSYNGAGVDYFVGGLGREIRKNVS